MNNLNKYRGCMLGGAVGDALGYAVEFKTEDDIMKQYGQKGITEYRPIDGPALISDDTQMSLFTANGLLLAATRELTGGKTENYPRYISLCYTDWLRTQQEQYPLSGGFRYTWLTNVSELFDTRAPGGTCLSAVQAFPENCYGTLEKPINHSKGCGGIMRVAPIGLYYKDPLQAGRIGAESAALTHGHELGYLPAAVLTHIISLVSHSDETNISDAVKDALLTIRQTFPHAAHMGEFISLIEKAIALSSESTKDLDAIHQLGEGWVAEETLAIAIYCALKYQKDFGKAIIASVNHNGDSDSTGAVTGNILGAYLGADAIPGKYLENLELRDVITEIADDLCNVCKIYAHNSVKDETWERKYIYKTFTI